jgi:hypothetical protein
MATIPPQQPDEIQPAPIPEKTPPQHDEPYSPQPPEQEPTPPDIDEPGRGPDELPPPQTS